MKHAGVTVWLTGLSGAGKSTLAIALAAKLNAYQCEVEILDGDVLRDAIGKGLTFTRADREENVRRIGFISKLLTKHGVISIVASMSPYRSSREEVRQQHDHFIEVYVNAPLEVCERRDVKGLYRKARNHEIHHLTGIDEPYEPPVHPDVECHTDVEPVEQCVEHILSVLEEKGYLDLTRLHNQLLHAAPYFC